VSTLDSGKVLVDGATPEEVISWLRRSGLKAGSIFEYRIQVAPAIGLTLWLWDYTRLYTRGVWSMGVVVTVEGNTTPRVITAALATGA